MARRKKHEEHENHERWLVSYADFITLLFAFFVVMYAVSSVNEGKYKTLSHSLIAAFHSPSRAVDPVQVGELARTRDQIALAIDEIPRNMPLPEHPTTKENEHAGEGQDEAVTVSPQLEAALAEITQQLVDAFHQLIEQDVITVRRSTTWVEIELNTSILFPSGSGELAPQAREILHQIAAILKPFKNPIRVEGFTDNLPINTTLYPSNWELSTARSARVVRLFIEEGVAPSRLAAVGFAEYRPVADNASADGRNQNRRVSLVILAGNDTRYQMDVQREESTVRLDGEAPVLKPVAPAPGSPGGGR